MMNKKLKRWVDIHLEDIHNYFGTYTLQDYEDFFKWYGKDEMITRQLNSIIKCTKKHLKNKISDCDRVEMIDDFIKKHKIKMCELEYKHIKKLFKNKKHFEKFVYTVCYNTTLKRNKKLMRQYAIDRLSLILKKQKTDVTYDDIQNSIFKKLFETKKAYVNFKLRAKKDGKI